MDADKISFKRRVLLGVLVTLLMGALFAMTALRIDGFSGNVVKPLLIALGAVALGGLIAIAINELIWRFIRAR
jgi:hypothetical protein